MAAPPVPPRGSPKSWLGEEKIGDHTRWRSRKQNSYSESTSQAKASDICFNDQFSPHQYDACSVDTSVTAPPLPPRRCGSVTWQKTQSYSVEINELSLVPPPPSIGQTFKKSQEMEDLIELSSPPQSKNDTSSRMAGVLFGSLTMPVTTNFTTTITDTVSVGQLKPVADRVMPENCIWKLPQSSVVYNTSTLTFTNSTYQSSIMPHMTQGFDIQHSKSAPDLGNCRPAIFSMDHRFSWPSDSGKNISSAINSAQQSVNGSTSEVSSKNIQASLENVLNFMKKKRDSNLIDLYCVDDVGKTKYQAPKLSQLDDVLKLFDPLTELPEEAISPSPPSVLTEAYDKTHNSKTEENSDTQVKTVNIKVYSNDRNSNHGFQGGDKKLPDESIRSEKTYFSSKLNDSPNIYCKIPSDSNGSVLKIVPSSLSCSEEIHDFCNKLKCLRSEFSYDDYPTNAGLVISPTLDSYQEEDSLSIKLIIRTKYSDRPVSFTCDVNTSIEHVVSHTVCTVLDDTGSLCMDNFALKVHGLSEYFSADSVLADYEYVHQCHKFDKPVCLTLTEIQDLLRPLARTKDDDYKNTNFKLDDVIPFQKKEIITYETLNILIDTLEKEIEKIKSNTLKSDGMDSLYTQGVVQAVKAICTLLSHVETIEIANAVDNIIQVSLLFGKSEQTDWEILPELNTLCSAVGKIFNEKKSKLRDLFQLLEVTLLHLHQAIQQLLIMYSRTFRVNFEIQTPKLDSPTKYVTDFLDTLLFQICMVHRLPPNWSGLYECYSIVCEIFHGETQLASVTSKAATITKRFFHHICFDEWIQFETISMCTLPREAVLRFTLLGKQNTQSDSKQSDSNQQQKTALGWCAVRLFTSRKELAQGSFLLGFWPSDIPKVSGPVLSNSDSSCFLLQINLPEFGCTVLFPPVIDNKFASSQMRDFNNLEPRLRSELMEIIERDSLTSLKPDEKELLWEKRYYLHKFPRALPKVLLAAHGWDWACLSDIYSLLKQWAPLAPVDALILLLPYFPDSEVRRTAIQWMKNIVSDELCDYLPQIVQVLRYETWEDSSIAWFLLERSLTSIRVAHHLYWLLKQNMNDPVAGQRMKLMLNALLVIAGSAVCKRIETQETLLENLSNIAEKVKTTKESLRLSILFHELEVTHHTLQENPTCLPLSPSMEICGVHVKSCSYFTSNTLPLKLSFHSSEKDAKTIEAIYKVGDDLRQDMLTLQMIRIMDKLWLKEGLDLKIVTFTCVATEYRKGMVELVPEAETLRKIQAELGLAGPFKDRPIAEWLQKHNTSELEYQQAVENFTLSCAGYCVATYILGICDRHNDNIMLKTSGHIFHIDFGKFLGDAQMFGNIKRDRTAFVLTSDMAYVINGGDKPSKKFQHFIDLCSQAFNIIRKHSSIFLNLFTLMVSSGIPGMSSGAVNYIQKALLPGLSEIEATAQFTHLIQESLKSWFTQFNFFIHTLAQLRFTGDHNEDLILSFIPKTFSKETDGKIISLDVIGCQKQYDPEKYYLYVIKVERQNLPVPMCVFRTYREFIEFHQKLILLFPLATFHPLPRNPVVGRANVREVADRRKVVIGAFLKSLMVMADEISHCTLVYTFFHPLLRDQEGMAEDKEARNATVRSRRSSSLGIINGQIKLSLVYKNDSLFIMIMHAKNLSSPKGTAPDPYVKTYLLPDPNKFTKRKTKTVSKSCHPTFMEMLVYRLPLEVVCHRSIHVSVWDYDRVQENEFLGATLISLREIDLHKEIVQWYPLGNFNN